MEKTVLILPDGTELSSGDSGKTAISQVTLTEDINEKQELEPGTVASAVMELTLLTHGSAPDVASGTVVTAFREDAGGNRRKIGVFISQKPEKKSAGSYGLTLCDNVSLLDRDLTDYLANLNGWPYPLKDFAEAVCHACGTELDFGQGLNGDYPVARFSASHVTGRQLISWVCQAAGTFCRADAEGKLYFSWYEDRGKQVLSTGTGNFYYQNSLSFSDFATEPVSRVQLQQTKDDVGVCFPETGEGSNALVITANPLITAESHDSLRSMAQSLYERISAISYTPCKLTVSVDCGIGVGEIFGVTDASGKRFTALAMSVKQAQEQLTVSCTGSIRREASAYQSLSYHALSGKVLELSATVDGIQAENRELSGKSAAFALSVEGIAAEVSRQNQSVDGIRQELTTLQQSARQVKLSVNSIAENGTGKVVTSTGYTFDEEGLHIQKSGQEMENRLTDTGMYVSRSGTVMLQADKDGVIARDVSVRNYLIIGSHARLEDYSDGTDARRTAVYWI